MAPPGRPSAGHTFVEGAWVHTEMGEPLDEAAHAAWVRAKKLACMRAAYWHRGGRQKRLNRYVRKCGPNNKQLTLESFLPTGGLRFVKPRARPLEHYGD